MPSAPPLERVPLDLPSHVRRAGTGDPIVLLHGFGASQFTWRRWPAQLAERHTLYLVDARGCGDSSKARGLAYGTDAMADDVVAMIRSLDLRRVTLIGHSLGGAVALLAILRLIDLGEGDRVAGFVSVAGVGYPQRLPKMMKRLSHPLVGRLFNLVPSEWLVRRILRVILADPSIVTQEMIEGYAAPLRSNATRRALFESVRDLVPENVDELVRRYPTVHVPALLIWGDRDGVVPLSTGKRLAKDLPNARLVVLQRCGHMPPEEKPDETVALVRDFLRGQERAATGG